MALNGFFRCWVGLVCVATFAMTGCTTVVWETAKKLRETRGTEAQFTDTKINANLLSGLVEKDLLLLIDVNADVWETRVLLTGTVTDSATHQDVVRKVRSDKRIQKIYDEIQIVSAAEQARRRDVAQRQTAAGKTSSDQPGTDYWIETKIAAKLVAAQNIVSVNYRWRSIRHTLYVIGCAASKQELAQVLALIRATDGVVRVKSFVEVKPA